jgi:hypothetical protein
MDRTDNSQEGITLQPTHNYRFVARAEAERIIMQHLRLCPFAALKIEERVRSLEGRFLLLLGFMAGSGFLGGATGALIIKALTP